MFIKDLYYTLYSEYAEKEVTLNGVLMTWRQVLDEYGDYSLVNLCYESIKGNVYFSIYCRR